MAAQEKISTYGYALTLSIAGLALIAYNVPQFSELLLYNRKSIVSGELWRLLTAPLVHFSADHLFWNMVIFGAAGLAIAAAGFRCFWLVCSIATLVPGLLFLIAFPELERYGGLSGLATGAAAYFCLCRAGKSKKDRMIWVAILIIMGAKILVEAIMDAPLFAHADKIPFRVLPSAHISGYLGAVATRWWVLPNIKPHRTPTSRHR
jgi:rhomboid family GlyGly-CTERM serine protease